MKLNTVSGPQKVFLVGVKIGRMPRRQAEKSLEELERLINTAGGVIVGQTSQAISRIEPATFLGKGKVGQIKAQAEETGADTVAIDEDLSPVQNRNLEKEIGLLVLDRTAVILDIFAMKARSNEGKLQVELAQLEYLAPRLTGRGQTLSQQTGRIGTRGPGETALEYDRRRMRDRITLLRRNLEHVRSHRKIHRLKREAVPVPLVSLVGYTNAGKSTLMNALTGSDVYVDPKLFATLDPTVRQLKLPSGRLALLADTVGFIRRLPHELVESFKSTFEEISHAKLLVHVIDGSDEEAAGQAGVVEKVLVEMELAQKQRIDVVNKCDIQEIHYCGGKDAIKISAKSGIGLPELLERIDSILKLEFQHAILKLPHDRGDILSSIYKFGHIRDVKYRGASILVDCDLHEKHYGKYKKYLAK